MTQSHLASRLNALFALWEGHAPAPIVKDLLSFAPTCHVISTASGMRFFTCCAVDTFLIAHLLDVNLIDTAECYGDHRSESLIGQAIQNGSQRLDHRH